MGRLGSGLRVVGRLGSGVWVSASFQFFLALTVLCGEGNFPDVGMSGGSMSEGGNVQRRNVLHSRSGCSTSSSAESVITTDARGDSYVAYKPSMITRTTSS